MVAVRALIVALSLPFVAPVLAQQAAPLQPPGAALTPLAAPAASGVPATWSTGSQGVGLGTMPQAILPQGAVTPSPAPEPASRPRVAPRDNGQTQHLLFERLPVHVLLAPGEERLVRFPFVPFMDLPPALGELLEVQIVEDTAYLTARGPLPRTRVHVQAIDGSAKLPLDVEAIEGVTVAPMLQVHLPSEGGAELRGGATEPHEAPPADMIQLTRFAAQTLYAPSRLVPVVPGVRQEPVDRKPVVGLYRLADVETAPLGSWSSGPLHVTAVRFTNRSSEPLELDMEQLRGRWIAATPQHWRLLPRGSEADTTAVYLVSDRPFAAVPLFR